MDEETRKATALKFFQEVESTMSHLYDRWQDEKDYEDIESYATPLIPQVEALGGHFLSMSKKPFGFTYRLDKATYKVSISQKAYKYDRIS